MRVLAADDCCGAGSLDLHAQGLQVVGCGNQVGFGLKIVGRMAAQEVGVGKGSELSGGHEGIQLVLNGLEVFSLAGLAGSVFSQLGSLGRISLEGAGDVHKVQGVQVVEVHDVVVQLLLGQEQVADIGGVGRNLEALVSVMDGVFQRTCGGQGVGVGADAAGTGSEVLHVAGIPALDNGFQAAEEGAAGAGILDLAILHFDFDAQMAFNTGQRINDNRAAVGRLRCFCHGALPSFRRTASYRPRMKARNSLCRDGRRQQASWSG